MYIFVLCCKIRIVEWTNTNEHYDMVYTSPNNHNQQWMCCKSVEILAKNLH